VKRALAKGYDLFNVLRVASLNPVKHYSLDIGLLQIGDPADFIIVDDLEKLNILKTFIDGKLVAEEGKTLIESIHVSPINNFSAKTKIESDFLVKAETSKIRVIKAYDGLLITDEIIVKSKIENGNIISDTENDILKIIVLNRYADALPAIGFINGFNLKEGAIATSVAHDSHNIIAVGTNDRDLTNAVNSVIESKGGLAVSNGNKTLILSLPVAGLMSAGDAWTVAETYSLLDKYAKEMGSKLNSPFMTLSFMALLVIPKLKLSDKGLFDGTTFQFTKLQVG
jgi:adenine deaminase